MIVFFNMPIESDADLVKRARSDPEAFGQLWLRYEERLYRYVYGMTGNAHDAWDLSYISLGKAYRNFYNPKPRKDGSSGEFIMWNEGAFEQWLYQIAHNTTANFLQRSSHRKMVALDAVPEDTAISSFMNPEEEAEKSDEIKTVRWAVGRLSPMDQESIWLTDIEGLSYDEVGRRTHPPISENAAKQRHLRAMKRFKVVFLKEFGG